MADFNFDVDFILGLQRLAQDLAKAEKMTTQSGSQIAKTYSDALNKINVKKIFDTKDVVLFGDRIRSVVNSFEELAQEGQVPLKILNAGFNEVAKNVTAAMRSMKIPKELRSEFMATFKDMRAETQKLFSPRNKENKVQISSNIEEVLNKIDSLTARLANLGKQKVNIDIGGFDAAGKKLNDNVNASQGYAKSDSSFSGPVSTEKTRGELRSDRARAKRNAKDRIKYEESYLADEWGGVLNNTSQYTEYSHADYKELDARKAAQDKAAKKAADKAANDKRIADSRAENKAKRDAEAEAVRQRKADTRARQAQAEADRQARREATEARRAANQGGSGGRGRGGSGGSEGGSLTDALNFLAFSQFSSALTRLTKDIISASGQMEQFQRRWSIVARTPDSSKNFDFLKQYAAQSPFDMREVMQTGIAFSAQAKTIKKLGRDFQDTIKMAGELGSINPDAGIVDAQKMISRIMAGDSNGLEIARSQFGISNDILADNGVLIGSNGVSLQSITQRRQVMDAIDKFIQDTTKGQGAMVQSSTLMGRISNLEDQIFQTSAALFEPLLPIMKEAVSATADFLKVLADLPDVLKIAIDAVLVGITALAGAAAIGSGVQWGAKAFGLTGMLAGGAAEAAAGGVAARGAASMGGRMIAGRALAGGLAQTGLAAGIGAASGSMNAGAGAQVATKTNAIASALTRFGAAVTSFPVLLIGSIFTGIALGIQRLIDLGEGGKINELQKKAQSSKDWYTYRNNFLDERDRRGTTRQENSKHLLASDEYKKLGIPMEVIEALGTTRRFDQRANDRAYLDTHDSTSTFARGNKKEIEAERERLLGIRYRARMDMIKGSDNPEDENYKKAQSDANAAQQNLARLMGKELSVPLENNFADTLDKLSFKDQMGDQSALGGSLVELTKQAGQWKDLSNDVTKNAQERMDFAQKARDAELKILQTQKQIADRNIAFNQSIISELAAVGKLSYEREADSLFAQSSMIVGNTPEDDNKRKALRSQALGVQDKAEQEALQTTIGLMKYRYGEEKAEVKSLTVERDKELMKFAGQDEKAHQARKAIWEKYDYLQIAARQRTLDTLVQMELDQVDMVRNIKAAQLSDQMGAATTKKDILNIRMDNKPYAERAQILKEIEKTNKSIEKSMQDQLKNDVDLIKNNAQRRITYIQNKLNDKSNTQMRDPKIRQQAREQIEGIKAERDQQVSSREKQYSKDVDVFRENNKKTSQTETIKNKKDELDAQYKTMEAAKAQLEFTSQYNDLASKNKSQYVANLKEQYELEKAMLAIKLQQETDKDLNPSKSPLEIMAAQKQNRIDLANLQTTYLNKLKDTTNELDKQNRILELQKTLSKQDEKGTYGVEDLNQRMQDESELFRLKAGFGTKEFPTGTQFGADHGNNPYYTGQDHGGKADPMQKYKTQFGMKDYRFDPEFGQYSTPKFKNVWEGMGHDNIQGRMMKDGSFGGSTLPSVIGNIKGQVDVNVNLKNDGKDIGKKSNKTDVWWTPYNNDIQ